MRSYPEWHIFHNKNNVKYLPAKYVFVLEIYKCSNQLSKANNIYIYFTLLTIYFEAFHTKFLAKGE